MGWATRRVAIWSATLWRKKGSAERTNKFARSKRILRHFTSGNKEFPTVKFFPTVFCSTAQCRLGKNYFNTENAVFYAYFCSRIRIFTQKYSKMRFESWIPQFYGILAEISDSVAGNPRLRSKKCHFWRKFGSYGKTKIWLNSCFNSLQHGIRLKSQLKMAKIWWKCT